MAYNEQGKSTYELKLLSTGGQRQFDTDKVISRYDHRMAMSCLADFILLGQDKVGSFALANSKTNLFTTAIGAFLDIIGDVFNRYAVPRLFRFNDFQISDYPKLMHGDLESVDLKEMGQYMKDLAASGMPLFPNAELEKYLMKAGHLPETLEEESDESLKIEPMSQPKIGNMIEVHDEDDLPINSIGSTAQVDGISSDTTPVNGAPKAKLQTNANSGAVPVTTLTENNPVDEDHIQAQNRALQLSRQQR